MERPLGRVVVWVGLMREFAGVARGRRRRGERDFGRRREGARREGMRRRDVRDMICGPRERERIDSFGGWVMDSEVENDRVSNFDGKIC
jgi:hypothetical protein